MNRSNETTVAPASAPHILRTLCVLTSFVVCLLVVAGMLFMILIGSGVSGHTNPDTSIGRGIIDRFDNFISNTISTAADGLIKIEKIYMLSDSDQVAPEPDPASFGKANDPTALQWLVNSANLMMDGQEMMFQTDTPILEGSEITYYLDDSIFAATWKQELYRAVYTISEVKIKHPSQIRRFLADGTFGSERQYLTSQMASSVNAVVASAGDFYKYRRNGIVVYNGKVERFNINNLDTCFIDDQGELIFSKAHEFQTQEEVQKYVDDHNIRFSLCFGPILLEEGQSCIPNRYDIGEIHDNFSRAALCQLGPLHYVIVTANDEGYYRSFPNLHTFAKALTDLGIEKAYTLDGGQTATIVMNDEVINHVSYGAERLISDILYFATAIPD